MQRFGGVEGAKTVDTALTSVDGEPLLRQFPAQAPQQCPHCGGQLYDGRPLTFRACLLRQLETRKSDEPTATLRLCEKVATMPEPFQLEDAEMALLKAAVQANGAQYFDVVQGKLVRLLDSAEPIEPAAPASE